MSSKKKSKYPTDEEIQEAILSYLGKKRKKARGVRGVSAKFSEIEKAVKNQFKNKKVTRGMISHNLDLLVQFGWISTEKEEKKLKSGMIVSQKRYKLSPEGIKYVGISPSRFTEIKKKYFGINVSNVSGIMIIGDRNVVVQENFGEAAKLLVKIGESIAKAKIPQEDKIDMIANIQTIEGQLLRKWPSKDILKVSLTELLEKVRKYAEKLAPVITLITNLKLLLGV